MNEKAINLVAVFESGELRSRIESALASKGICFIDRLTDWPDHVASPDDVRAVITTASSGEEFLLAYQGIKRSFKYALTIFVLPDADIRVDSLGLREEFFCLTQDKIDSSLLGLVERALHQMESLE